MVDSSLIKKYYQKMRLVNTIKDNISQNDYVVNVLRFNHFTILACFYSKDEQKLKEYLVKKGNMKIIRDYAKKKKTVLHLEQIDMSNEFDELISNDNIDFNSYLTKIQKIYLAENNISDINFLNKMVNLSLLYISNSFDYSAKNELKSLRGI